MKFVFIVQGEGRGHMTQAIAFSKMLEDAGHQLAAVILGKSKRRAIPEFFSREIKAPVHWIPSPNFETDKGEKRILIGKTILSNLKKLPVYWQSLNLIHKIIQTEKPDVILNFYDLLGGFYSVFFQPKSAYWVIGHQYLTSHPDFIFAPSKGFQKQLFQLNTWMTALGADERLALAFLPMEADCNSKVRIVPPLLRREVKELTPIEGDFYLAYMVNCGYGEEIISFAKANPNLKIKAYWDKKGAGDTENPLPNLSFHQIHDKNFLQDMAACKGLVCTAGFESVCEAMYLGKPVMMIPVAGQYEQACNALDAVAAGAGIKSEEFDFGYFDQTLSKLNSVQKPFKNWVKTWDQAFTQLTTAKSKTYQETVSEENLGEESFSF
ncbi:MAG: glycosyltransferase family protein [Algoriphagus sp.]|nr:glycosyltransferase family protein [Algoriphagus sp.]